MTHQHIEGQIGDNASHVNIGKNISSVSVGDVHGDIKDSIIVGRDVHIHRLDPADVRNQRNHRALRQLVKSFWIDGVLKHSLYNEVLIRLNLQEQPDRVDNRPWNLIQRQPGEADRLLPPNTSIIDVFDQMNQLLLILGEPGSGKTTTLLELARDLLVRAEADPTHPTPVVFNLSSWSQRKQPLAKWLVEEIRDKYNIPEKIAKNWIVQDELLLLLDGLDEVMSDDRDSCVETINQFRQEHLIPIVVCSRSIEYRMLIKQLKLQGAISLQALTDEQITAYLDYVGEPLGWVQSALQRDKKLREFVSSPLLLTILSITSQRVSPTKLMKGGMRKRRTHLLDAYILHMFSHRDKTDLYQPSVSLQWLRWLASELKKNTSTIFLIEHLQPSYLPTDEAREQYATLIGLIASTIFSLILGGLTTFIYGIKAGFLILAAGYLLFIAGKDFGKHLPISPVSQMIWSLEQGKEGITWGLIIGLAVGGLIALTGQIQLGFIIGSTGGIMTGFAVGFVAGISRIHSQTTQVPNEKIWQSGKNALFTFLIFGILSWGSALLPAWILHDMGSALREGGITATMGALFILGWHGGLACIQHLSLRLILWRLGHIDLNYARFLDYCVDRIFLRRVGGGYIFIHRLLLEHFISLTDEDIKRIVLEVKESKAL